MKTKAFLIAFKAHRGQKDKAGKPYILHPLNVAMHSKGEARKTVALLHDVVEDTDTTIEQLKQAGFNDEITAAVEAITRQKGEAYDDYLCRVAKNDIAKDVKIADVLHNSDLRRLKTITPKDVKRLNKYANALNFLICTIDKKAII